MKRIKKRIEREARRLLRVVRLGEVVKNPIALNYTHTHTHKVSPLKAYLLYIHTYVYEESE